MPLVVNVYIDYTKACTGSYEFRISNKLCSWQINDVRWVVSHYPGGMLIIKVGRASFWPVILRIYDILFFPLARKTNQLYVTREDLYQKPCLSRLQPMSQCFLTLSCHVGAKRQRIDNNSKAQSVPIHWPAKLLSGSGWSNSGLFASKGAKRWWDRGSSTVTTWQPYFSQGDNGSVCTFCQNFQALFQILCLTFSIFISMCEFLIPIPSFVCLSCYKGTSVYEVNLCSTNPPWLSCHPCLSGFILKICFLISLSHIYIYIPH